MASTYRDHVVLCGLGHLGLRVLEELREACVDYDCNRVRDIFARVVRGFDDRYPCADALGERLNERAAGQRPRLKMLAPVKSG